MKTTAYFSAIVFCVFSILACTQRTITITSTPPGALVHLNDQEIGVTPVTTKFLYYGTYDVKLKKAGYDSLWTSQKAIAPWWEAPGPDLFAELNPDSKVALRWHYQLKRHENITTDTLFQNAADLRAIAKEK